MPNSKLTPTFDPGDLDGLLLSCHRNKRLPKFPVKEPKYFSDAERFRWWFRYGAKAINWQLDFGGMDLTKIRDWLDTEMRKHPEQVHL